MEQSRRQFLRLIGLGAAALAVPAVPVAPVGWGPKFRPIRSPLYDSFGFGCDHTRARRISSTEPFTMDIQFPKQYVLFIGTKQKGPTGKLSDIPKGLA